MRLKIYIRKTMQLTISGRKRLWKQCVLFDSQFKIHRITYDKKTRVCNNMFEHISSIFYARKLLARKMEHAHFSNATRT